MSIIVKNFLTETSDKLQSQVFFSEKITDYICLKFPLRHYIVMILQR